MENIDQSSKGKTKNITFLSIIKWVFGIIFIITGLVTIFSQFIPGVAFLVIGLVSFPSFIKFLKNRFNFTLSRNIKIVSIIILLIIIGSTYKNKPKTDTTIAVTTVDNVVKNETPQSKAQEVPVAIAPTPKTLEEKISDAVNSSLGTQTNTQKPRLVNVEVTKYTASMLSEYGYKSTDNISSVLITINSDENITSNLQKSTMDNEASKLIKSVFPVDSTIGDIIIWSQLPVQDQYGNAKDSTAIVFSVSRPLSAEINWSNFNYRDLPTLLKSEGKTDDRNGYFEKIKF